ncbi:MAG: hypothetical protein IPN53_14990 [Comamonadaceae bacterium]|nr:hypothetical protein [Comamonadaceae bacterium]
MAVDPPERDVRKQQFRSTNSKLLQCVGSGLYLHFAGHNTIAADWRVESAHIITTVARCARDLGGAKELAQDALAAALEHWPKDGVPNSLGAWLMTTAINRALDWLRHRQRADARHGDIASDHEAMQTHVVPDFTDAPGTAHNHAAIGEDLLRLIFTACHPVLARDARVALTLKLFCGLHLSSPCWTHLLRGPKPLICYCCVQRSFGLSAIQETFLHRNIFAKALAWACV